MTTRRRGARPAGRTRWRKLAARVLAVTAIAGGLLGAGALASAGAAQAAPAPHLPIPHLPIPLINPVLPIPTLPGTSCKSAPVPQAPGQGMSGFLELRPARPPAPAAAFGAHPGSTEFVQDGYGGLFWATYDLGCIPNPLTATPVTFDTEAGNWLLGAAKTIVAADNTAHTWASDPSWTASLTPLVAASTSALYRALFVTWSVAALMIVGLSVMLRAHRADMPSALTLVSWAVMVIGVVSAVVVAPGWAGQQASELMGETLNALDAGFVGPGGQASAAQAHASMTVSAVLYPAWLRGEFGDPGSAAARQFGPQLFQAQALTWSQAAGSPQQISATDSADQGQWQKVAGEIQSVNPQAYTALQGKSQSRIGAGLLALLTAVIVCTFDFIASLIVIAALLAVLASVVMLPALGVVGMHHSARGVLTRLASRVLGMLINAVGWAAAAGVDLLATRALLTQSVLSPAETLGLLAIIPIVLWMILRVVRGRPAVPRAARRAALLGLGLAYMRRGARAAGAAGAAAQPVPDMWYQDPSTWQASQIMHLPPPGAAAGSLGLPSPGGGGGLPPVGGGRLEVTYPNGSAALPRPRNGGELPPGSGPSPLPPPAGGGPLPPGSDGPPALPPPGGGGALPQGGAGRALPAANGHAAPPPAGGENGARPPAGSPSPGRREYDGTPGAAPVDVTASIAGIYQRGQAIDPAATYDSTRLYDGGGQAPHLPAIGGPVGSYPCPACRGTRISQLTGGPCTGCGGSGRHDRALLPVTDYAEDL